MSDYLTTRELAALLRIKERKVYDLASRGQIPCARAHGKLLFPRQEVEAWVARGRGAPGAASRSEDLTGSLMRTASAQVFVGSYDPLLEWALSEARCGLPTYFDGSADGLDRLARGEGIAAGLHLYDAESATFNVTSVNAACSGRDVALIEWAKRLRGFVVGSGAGAGIKTMNDLAGRRVVMRQGEAGSQRLFEHLLQEAGAATADFAELVSVRTENDAVLAVLEGRADVAFGLKSLASVYQLDFVPLIEERFDIAVDRRAYFEPPLQKLFDFSRSQTFLRRAEALAGTDISGMGTVHWNSPA